MNLDIAEILNLFIEPYNETFHNLSYDQHCQLHLVTPSVFKKWCYSVLLNNTILTPADVLAPMAGDGAELSVFLKHAAIGKPLNANSFQLVPCTKQSHPFLRDMKLFLSAIEPRATFTKFDLPNIDLKEQLMSILSIPDCAYVDYLNEIAFRLGLIIKLPSIHTNAVQPKQGYQDYLDNFTKNDWLHLIDIAAQVCVEKVKDSLESPKQIFTKEDILSFIKNPIHMNDIFEFVHKHFGAHSKQIESFLQEQDDDVDMDAALLSLAFCSGLIIDQWFLTPFGDYLKIIRPVYLEPYCIEEEIRKLASAIITNNHFVFNLFSPCTYYNKTSFGNWLMKGETKSNIPAPENTVSVKQLVHVVHYERELPYLTQNKTVFIYTLKIKSKQNKREWKAIEIHSIATLDQLRNEINFIFELPHNSDYRFVFKETTFLPPKTNSSYRLETDTTKDIALEDLDIAIGEKFCYQSQTEDNTISFDIELVKINDHKYNIIYPRIVRQGKKTTPIENEK